MQLGETPASLQPRTRTNCKSEINEVRPQKMEEKQVELSGRVCVITGASIGIGRSLAVALGRQGASLALLARSKDRLDETQVLVEAAGGKARSYPTDFRDIEAVSQSAESILRDFGDIFLIANVAGVWHDEDKAYQGPLLPETPTEEILEVLDVGIRAPIVLTSRLLPSMVEQKAGHVINISGTFSDGAKGWLHYYVSKKALEEFTVGLAQEMRDFEIQVNCISPADVATEPYKRFYPEYAAQALQPEEIAEVALMLLAESSRHISGQIIEIRNRSDHE